MAPVVLSGAMLNNPDTIGRLHMQDRDAATDLARSLAARAAQIVRTWD